MNTEQSVSGKCKKSMRGVVYQEWIFLCFVGKQGEILERL